MDSEVVEPKDLPPVLLLPWSCEHLAGVFPRGFKNECGSLLFLSKSKSTKKAFPPVSF